MLRVSRLGEDVVIQVFAGAGAWLVEHVHADLEGNTAGEPEPLCCFRVDTTERS